MAENGGEKVYAAATANPYGRVDEELASVAQREERRKKRMKYVAYGAAFVVFQTAVILVFSLVVMKVRTPKFRVRSATFQDFKAATLPTNSSFSTQMFAELCVKNPNFGRYKYQDSTVEFFYQNYKVGEAAIPKGKASFKSTKKFAVPVDLSSTNVPGDVLGSELSQHAWIPLTSRATLNGKVRLMLIFTKKKSTNMSCTMNLNTSSKQLQDLECV
ncbi:late embryogenesis abundant protein At1g64065-like [Coffea eugenioides]|uniref:late embryogenesis abundant protein At1g64065-like n=1 Tax=Coffea eugenioides TaxID=49369 RepID=UPI000F60E128|nr:late embryogenesis abundant protein At1g64065-like [Coffea eugenioides]